VLADSDSKEGVDNYNEARRRARQLGFDYIENAQLVAGPAAERLERLETLVAKDLVELSFYPRLGLAWSLAAHAASPPALGPMARAACWSKFRFSSFRKTFRQCT
jgi:hypothetical protein